MGLVVGSLVVQWEGLLVCVTCNVWWVSGRVC